jgi:hypothetical protein
MGWYMPIYFVRLGNFEIPTRCLRDSCSSSELQTLLIQVDPKGIEPFFILVKSQEQRQILLRILCVRLENFEISTPKLKV